MRKIENTFEKIHKQVGGKWKLSIINELMSKPRRFNELKKSLPGISQKVLSETLKSLEKGGLINKMVYEDYVLHTEYSLTLLGSQLGRLVEQLATWYSDFSQYSEEECEEKNTIFYLPNKTARTDYKYRISEAKKALKEADNILVGVGSGVLIELGIDHRDRETAEKYFPAQFRKGFNTIREMILYYGAISSSNEISYWNFWSSYIDFVLKHNKESKVLNILKEILNNRNYFIITTNADHAIFNCGFDNERLLEILGSSVRLQCNNGCNDAIYEARPFIEKMLSDKDENGDIKKEYIPMCPICGDYLVINHRQNQLNWFVESPTRHKKSYYDRFIEDSLNKKTVLLEIGCRLHFPELIRLSFEQFVMKKPQFKLIRVNSYDCSVTNKELTDSNRVLLFNEKIYDVLKDILDNSGD